MCSNGKATMRTVIITTIDDITIIISIILPLSLLLLLLLLLLLYYYYFLKLVYFVISDKAYFIKYIHSKNKDSTNKSMAWNKIAIIT